jgi:hypothetical protein
LKAKEFGLWAAFIFALGFTAYYVARTSVVGETEKCATLCGATNLQHVYLPRARACLCSDKDGTLKVPHNDHVQQED